MYRAFGQVVPVGKRILELNPSHPLVTGLREAHKERVDDPSVAENDELLYGTVLLAEGGALEDPARFAELVADPPARTVWAGIAESVTSSFSPAELMSVRFEFPS
jgi:molecular chaperone HtpG